MIQVCSQCGTRWNVRDRERVWCPRCHGTLLAASPPVQDPDWSARPTAAPVRPPAPRLQAGYRWIAVRPGAAPPARRRRAPLGPTPRYPYIPGWGLVDQTGPPVGAADAASDGGTSPGAVRGTLFLATVVLGIAALVHVARYVLLIVNRDHLLSPWIAGAATWLGIAASVAAILAVVASAVLLTGWLISRRAAAYQHHGQPEPRTVRALWAGCLVPLVNLLWAPVFVIELAHVEDRYPRLRRSILVWWIVWVASTAVSVFSIATSFTSDAQGIADNTVSTTVAYLVAAAAVAATTRVFEGFERNPVERPARRWLIIPADRSGTESGVPVESEGQEPAA